MISFTPRSSKRYAGGSLRASGRYARMKSSISSASLSSMSSNRLTVDVSSRRPSLASLTSHSTLGPPKESRETVTQRTVDTILRKHQRAGSPRREARGTHWLTESSRQNRHASDRSSSIGSDSRRPSLASDSRRPSLASDSRRPSLASDSRRPSLVSDSRRPSIDSESIKERLHRNQDSMHRLFEKSKNRARHPSGDPTNVSYKPPMSSTTRKSRHSETRTNRQTTTGGQRRFASPGGSSSHDSAVELDSTESQQSSPCSSDSTRPEETNENASFVTGNLIAQNLRLNTQLSSDNLNKGMSLLLFYVYIIIRLYYYTFASQFSALTIFYMLLSYP